MGVLITALGSLGLIAPALFSPRSTPTAFLDRNANKYQRAQAQTVLIKSTSGEGSGVVLHQGDSTVVWTADHVVAGDTIVIVNRILRWHGHKAGVIVFTAKVLAHFPEVDAALLLVDCPITAFEGATFSTADPVPGTTLFHVGNLLGDAFDGSVTRGILSQVGVHPNAPGWPWVLVDQTDLRCLPGSSGGPVFSDVDGKVVGILVGGPGQGTLGISCYIPVRELLRVAKEYRGAILPSGNIAVEPKKPSPVIDCRTR